MQIYNSLTRQKENFEPIDPPNVRMYNCGPTVYDYFHIGNARNFVVVDMIRRYLTERGYKVTFVQNFTDIDDKIINRANEQGVPWSELVEKYTKYYWEQVGALNILEADVHPKATTHIDDMINGIKTLIEKGNAYEAGGSVYFRARSFERFGELSGRKMDEQLAGTRLDVDENKEDPADFVLWKAQKPGEPAWPSPWGPGRPGWHIECSVMILSHLGEQIDIHSGGADLKFPHHENERAQSECITGLHPMVKYWVHNGFLTTKGEKMSKSLGNFFKINEVLNEFEPVVVRWFLLSGHYRTPLDFSREALEEGARSIERVRQALRVADSVAALWEKEHGPIEESLMDQSAVQSAKAPFYEAMDDDFNTPRAYAVLFEIMGRINKAQGELNKIDGDEKVQRGPSLIAQMKIQAAALRELLAILGIEVEASAETGSASLEGELIELLIDMRAMARKAKQFEIADAIRDRLSELGITLEDTAHGTIWKK
jgi:cysteinyl-tRNA synthetase